MLLSRRPKEPQIHWRRWLLAGLALVLLPPAQWFFGVFPFPSPFVGLLVVPGLQDTATVEKQMLARIRSTTGAMNHDQTMRYLGRLGLTCQTGSPTNCHYRQIVAPPNLKVPLAERGVIVHFGADESKGVAAVRIGLTGP